MTKYPFIESHPEYALAKWARMLRISMFGYHAYIRRKESNNKSEEEYWRKIKKLFDGGQGTYGVDRICGLLRKNGSKASYERVKDIMKESGLFSIHRRRCQRSLTDRRKPLGDGYPNLMRDIEITEQFHVISSGISYIRSDEGFGYTCQIRDEAINLVLVESMSNNIKKALVIQTIEPQLSTDI